MKILSVAAALVLLTAPAFAQDMPHMNLVPELASKTPEEKEQDAIRDKAYKESLKKIPDAKTSSDPWGAVRNNDAPKAAAPTKPKDQDRQQRHRQQQRPVVENPYRARILIA
jgi:hypothetical protein